MASAPETAPPARLKTRYLEEIRPQLIDRFGYSSVMQAPKIEKITLNMGVGLAKQDSKMMKTAGDQLATIAGQRPSVRRARKSIAAFKLREGMPVGVSVTLRGERSYEFLDRLVTIAIPRIRDFRGLSPRSFDGRGNYSLGVKEQIIFPEVDYDEIDQVRGLDITITTTAATDAEAYALLSSMGMPFASQGRPRGFDPEADAADARAHEEAEAAKAQAAEARPAARPAEAEAPAETAGPPADAEGAEQAAEGAEQAPEGAEQAPEGAEQAPATDEAASSEEPAAAEEPAAEPEEPQAAGEAETAEPEHAAEDQTETAEKESTD
jgi:large subunit ribosomal protein L5